MKITKKSLFKRLKRLLFRKKQQPERKLRTKTCPSCGRTILYDPYSKFVPHYCAECSPKFRSERGMITRTCKICGKTFTLPDNVQHWPNCCMECRAKQAKTK